MNFLHLQYFRAIARSGSVSAASRELHVAQPSLSRALMSLEEEVGCRLFDRIGKSLALNRQGEILLKHAEQVFLSLNSAQKELDDSTGRGANEIVVRVASGAAYFVSRLALFAREHPQLALRVLDAAGETAGAAADLTIFATEAGIEENEHQRTLLRERMALAVPCGHRLAGEARVCVEDLAGEPMLAASEGTALRRCFDRCFEEAGLIPVVSCEFANASLLKTLIANGLGSSLVPETTWADVESGGLAKLVPLDGVSFSRFVHLKLAEGRYLSEACRQMADFLSGAR
ncbi:MAG: LysR family transcriptional regulator [Pyramidobacter sp.]|nr:LysR family transcriptional regulator [Pyramidobacter sp.]